MRGGPEREVRGAGEIVRWKQPRDRKTGGWWVTFLRASRTGVLGH